MEKLAGHAPADSMEVDAAGDPAEGVRALVRDCKFTMNLEMANSAWKQVNEGGGSGGEAKEQKEKKPKHLTLSSCRCF